MAVDSARWSYTRPHMYPKQEAAIFDPRRYSLIEATTKSGKSVSAMVWLTEQAMLSARPGRHYWWVAPIFAQAKIIFDRLQRRLPPGLFEVNKTSLTIRILPTDATIDFKGADNPDSLYGEDVWAAVIDEASRVKETAWHAVRSTLTATRGPIRIIGNVKGRKNWFFALSRRAEKGDSPDMGYHKITAYDATDAGVLAVDEIENAKAMLPEAVFKELYEAEASDDEGNPFGLTSIEACAVDFVSVRPVVAYGVDLARKHDYTVVIGLDQYGFVASFQRFQHPWPKQVQLIRDTVGMVPTLVDASGLGDVVVGFLQNPVTHRPVPDEALAGETPEEYSSRLDRIYREVEDPSDLTPGLDTELQKAFGDTSIEGYVFNQRSKQGLMEGLAVAIQHQNVHFPRWAGAVGGGDHVLKLELESYEYVYTRTGVRYSAPEGEYDDTVCALALAVQCLQTRALPMQIDFDLASMVEGFTQQSTWNLGDARRSHGEEVVGEISLGW